MATQRLLNAEQGERICEQLARITGSAYTKDTSLTSQNMVTQGQGEKAITFLNKIIAQKGMSATSWAGASDEDLVTIISMADNGEIDLVNDLGWAVGDTRDVLVQSFYTPLQGSDQMIAAYIRMVLADTDHFDLVTPTASGRTKSNFVVIGTDCFTSVSGSGSNNYYSRISYLVDQSNTSGTYPDGLNWSDCQLRTVLNEVVHETCLGVLKPIFKEFYVNTGKQLTNEIETTPEWVTIPSTKEIFGESGSGSIYIHGSTPVSSGNQNYTVISDAEYNATSQLQYFEASTHRVIDYSKNIYNMPSNATFNTSTSIPLWMRGPVFSTDKGSSNGKGVLWNYMTGQTKTNSYYRTQNNSNKFPIMLCI